VARLRVGLRAKLALAGLAVLVVPIAGVLYVNEMERLLLEGQTQALLARKQIVETLQSNRTEAVHLLDQMVRQLPDGIYLKSLQQVGAKVTLVGYAQSSARVSTLMRNIEASPWLQSPELVEIKAVAAPGSKELRVNEFTLKVQLKQTAPPEEPKASPAARPAPAAKRPPATAKGAKSS